MGYKPMLAAEAVLGAINYGKQGMVVLPKHNGVRGGNQDGVLMSRSLKPIPNLYTRGLLSKPWFHSLEGELVVGDPFDEEVFTNSTSGVMTKAGEPDFKWYLFDMFDPKLNFLDRLHQRDELFDAVSDKSRVELVPWHLIHSDAELVALSDLYLGEGYEGVVLRSPTLQYKQGRSTAKEQGFMRYCPWIHSEGVIIAINEGTINLNESKVNELGYKRKSSHKENIIPSGQAGTFTVKDPRFGVHDIKIQTDALQKEVWANQGKYLGKLLKYRCKPPVNIGGKPRFAQMEGLRHPDDM